MKSIEDKLAFLNDLEKQKQFDKARAKSDSKNKELLAEKVRKMALKEIKAVEPGLTVICVRESHLLLHTRCAFEKLIQEQSQEVGVPMPQVKGLLSVISGNSRMQQQAFVLSHANPVDSDTCIHEIHECGTKSAMDWLSEAGVCLALPIIEEHDGVVTFEQKVMSPLTPNMLDCLYRMRNAAQKAGAWAMIFLVCDGYEKTYLHELCDEYFEVESCEPSPGFDIAFSIDCVGLRDLNLMGIGKTLCEVKLINGVFKRHFTPFISSNLLTRFMSRLRSEGKTFEEIGALVGQNKSSVLRRLQSLPKVTKPISSEKLGQWLEACGLDAAQDASTFDHSDIHLSKKKNR